MTKRTFTKYPSGYINASTFPSYQDADYTRYDHHRSEGLPQGKVLIVSEDKDYRTANGFCCTTKYGDIFGSNDVYYLLTDDDTLYRTQSRYRDFSYSPNFFEELFETGGFVKCFNDYWINYKSI